MKRKRGKDKALAADDGVSTSKGPAPLSSNWLELQAVGVLPCHVFSYPSLCP